MAAEWYYTTNKQQMGPVSWEELQQLAGKELLKPGDLVWTEGMAEWVKASRQPGLFPETAASRPAVDETPPRRSGARRRDDDRDDRDERDWGERRKGRAAGSNTGLKIGLAIGAVVLVLLFLVCGVGGVVAIFLIDWGGGGGGPNNYNVTLAPGTQNLRNFTWRAGQRVQVTVTTDRNPGFIQPDVDLYILRGGGVVASDTRISPDCNVTFVAPANDSYTVRVVNLGPGRANSHVNIHAP